jgi:hypothetical protein
MKHSITRTKSFVTYENKFFTVDICKTINNQPIKSQRIMVVFSNGEDAAAVFLNRRDAAYLLRNKFKNNYKRLTEKGWR